MRLPPGLLLHVKGWVWFTLLINALPLFTPILNEGDSVLYAALSQHMVSTGNWNDLMLDGRDWLDKPHFPFWLGALSFASLGVSVFAYMLPGYLCHLLGAFYTYRLARQWLDRDAAWMSVLVYVSAYHLMYTTTALKAEAFLTGSIMGAAYHWWRFEANSRVKHVCLGAAYTGMAVMTKGVFTLVTIASGLVGVWLYQRRWREWLRPKWWLALGLTAVCVLPELIALYRQFDMHPEKQVLGRTGVSGIVFFLWDSQFGRFFNTGPITNQGGHPLYFVAVFAWAFLPWVAAFGASLWQRGRGWRQASVQARTSTVFLLSSFGVSFVMFSLTKFQLDYYTVIVYPFAAMLCAPWLVQGLSASPGSKAVFAQGAMVLATLALALWVTWQVDHARLWLMLVVMVAAVLVYVAWQRQQTPWLWLVALPVWSVNGLYLSLEGMTVIAHTRYSIPYNVKPWLAHEPELPVVVYRLDPPVAYELGLYRPSAPSIRATAPEDLPEKGAYFLLVKDQDLDSLKDLNVKVTPMVQGQWVDHKTGTLPRQIALAAGRVPLERFSVFRVQPRD